MSMTEGFMTKETGEQDIHFNRKGGHGTKWVASVPF